MDVVLEREGFSERRFGILGMLLIYKAAFPVSRMQCIACHKNCLVQNDVRCINFDFRKKC